MCECVCLIGATYKLHYILVTIMDYLILPWNYMNLHSLFILFRYVVPTRTTYAKNFIVVYVCAHYSSQIRKQY